MQDILKIAFTILSVISSFNVCSQTYSIQETCLTNNEFENRYASYSPDGNKIVFESNRTGNWDIYLMDDNGENQARLIGSNYSDRRPSWHPDGKKILFESDRNGNNNLYLFNLKTRKITWISNLKDKGEPMFGSFSPNGKFIAIGLKEGEERSNIILLDKQGKIVRVITDEDRRSTYPRWSKNGKELVYFSRKDTDNEDDEIYRLDLESGNEIRLTDWPKHNFCPSWSFVNNKIAYVTSMEATRPEIYIMDSNGENQRRITENTVGDTLPGWHPNDENKLLITGFRNGSYQICVLILDD